MKVRVESGMESVPGSGNTVCRTLRWEGLMDVKETGGAKPYKTR